MRDKGIGEPYDGHSIPNTRIATYEINGSIAEECFFKDGKEISMNFDLITVSLLIGVSVIVSVRKYRAGRTNTQPVHRGTKCGHELVNKTLTLFGKEESFTFSTESTHRYCAECLVEGAGKCTDCQEPIFHGDEIAVHYARDGKLPENAQVFKENSPFYVTCGDCTDCVDQFGLWLIGPDGSGYADIIPDSAPAVALT